MEKINSFFPVLILNVYFPALFFFTLSPNLLSSICKDLSLIHQLYNLEKKNPQWRRICCKLDFENVLICNCSLSWSKQFLINLSSGWGSTKLKRVVLGSVKCLSQVPLLCSFSQESEMLWWAYFVHTTVCQHFRSLFSPLFPAPLCDQSMTCLLRFS